MKDLKQILAALQSTPSGDAVLATLVKVEGSSYRRAGARLLLLGDGRHVGGISGGCLEDDVLVHARDVRASGSAKTVKYDTTSENDLVWGVGLGCHGVVHVLIEKLPNHPIWADTLRENLGQRRPTGLAVVWRGPTGTPLGTYLASEMPSAPIGVNPEIPAVSNLPGRQVPPPRHDEPSPGVFYQTVPAPTALVIFGAGDDVIPLVRFAKELGWHVTVADPRPAFATNKRFPDADALFVAPAAELATHVFRGSKPLGGGGAESGEDGLVVVMTHHYLHDLPLLRTLLPRPLAYLGLLGPRKRSERILADLAAEGLAITPAMRSRLHAPVGLDLGAENPEEVALAIMAEMKALLAGRNGHPLRERQQPIHG